MDLPTAGRLAQELMAAHGLPQRGWTFRFNHARRQLGRCDYTRRRIELSAPFVMRNVEHAVRDTILHEIAHALAGHAAGHGSAWRAACERIGATPKRTCASAVMPRGAFTATCPGCGQQHHRHRRPARGRIYFCRACGRERGRLKFLTNAAIEPRTDPLIRHTPETLEFVPIPTA